MKTVVKRFAAALFCTFLATGAQAENAKTETLFAATLTGLDGKPVALARYRGKPLVVNFWARWCAPCRTEIPELVALQKEHAGEGLVVLGIALEEDAAKVREFLTAYGANYPVVLDRGQGIELMRALGNTRTVLPFTLLVDRKGEIVLHQRGEFRREDFRQAEMLMR